MGWLRKLLRRKRVVKEVYGVSITPPPTPPPYPIPPFYPPPAVPDPERLNEWWRQQHQAISQAFQINASTKYADVYVYTQNGHYYAADNNGNVFCVDSPTACLQEAVNYVAQFGGGRIFIRRGVYNISGPASYLPSGSPVAVTIPDGIKLIIEGEGSSTVIKDPRAIDLFVHDVATSGTWTSELIFRNFKIDRSQASGNMHMITVYYARKFIVDGIDYVGNLSGTPPNATGDTVISGVNNIYAEVKNCRLHGALYGTWVFAYNNHIHDNYGELLAQAGFSGAGLLPNFDLPDGFTPGGVTVIENNACVDCALNEVAYSVDYGSNNPFVPNSIGIIRNNILQMINYSGLGGPGGVNVGELIIEGNTIIGNLVAAAGCASCNALYIRKNYILMNGYVATMQPSIFGYNTTGSGQNPDYVEISDNYVNYTGSSNARGQVITKNTSGGVGTLVIRNNILNINYQYTSPIGHIIGADSGVARFIFEDNVVNASIASGGSIAYLIGLAENPTLYVRVRNNRVSITNPGYPGGLIEIVMNNSYTGVDVPLVDISNNYVYNSINTGYIAYFYFENSANLLYLKLRHNITRNMSNQAYINSVASGLTPTIIVESELANPLANLPSGVTLNFLHSSKGVATIASGSTSVTVNHGLVCTPSRVLITPLAQPSGNLWVSDITSTSFTINISTAPSADLPVAWYAEC